MRRRRTASLAATALVAVALSGCAASNDAAVEAQGLTEETANDPVEPIGPGSTMTVESFEWGFEVVEGFAVDGGVEITLVNIGDAEHNIRIDGAAGETVLVQAAGGAEATDTIQLFGSPGGQAYTFYCDIPGHRAQGMEGELYVYSDAETAEQEPTTADEADATA